MPAVSVIVPVYNVEQYLRRCLDSLCAQTMNDVEFILVDDGSTDHSSSICDSYAENDSRFRVIHRKNGGLSAARNTGIEAASGTYLMFADSDDWVEPGFCEYPYERALMDNAQLVIFSYTMIDFPSSKIIQSHEDGPISEEEAMYLLHHGNSLVAWNKMYYRTLFDHIRYPEGRLFEDLGTTYKFVHEASSISYLDMKLYNYCYHSSSLSHKSAGKGAMDNYELSRGHIRDLDAWGYKELAYQLRNNMELYYLVSFGANGPYGKEASAYCRSLPFRPKNYPLDHTIMLNLYRAAPPLFDLAAKAFGKRYELPE